MQECDINFISEIENFVCDLQSACLNIDCISNSPHVTKHNICDISGIINLYNNDVKEFYDKYKLYVHNQWIKKQQTFSNLSTDELKKISSQLWLPNKINGKHDQTGYKDGTYNGKLVNIKSNSWFNINLISKIINDDKPKKIYKTCSLSESYNKHFIEKNEALEKAINICDFDEINKTLNEIDDCPKTIFNPLKKKFKKQKKKGTVYDPKKPICKFTVTTLYNGVVYGRLCGGICESNLDVCKTHTNKNEKEYDKFTENVCQHIITQKSGGKNGNSIVDRKGMYCREFTFDSKNDKYCVLHSKSHKTQELDGKETVERSFHVRFYPTKEQSDKLEEMFGSKRKTYNMCIENEVGKHLTESETKKKYVTNIKNDEQLNYLTKTPEDVRTFAIKEYYTNYNNAENVYSKKLENEEYKQNTYYKYKPREIQKPELKYQRKKDSQSINIEKKLVKVKDNKIYIYPKLFKNEELKIRNRQLKHDKKLETIFGGIINHDIKILKTTTDKYYICFVIDNEKSETKEQNKIGAMDTNIRNLGTMYGENEIYEFGTDMYEKIIPMLNKKDKLKKEYRRNIKRIINKEIEEKEFKTSKMKYRKEEEKIRNRIDDLHYKVINKLMNVGYTKILIPKLNIKKMLEEKDTPKIVKRIAQTESHMKFIKRLEEKGIEKGVTIKIINENMTTQTCGKCFNKYKFSGEIYECEKCGIKMGRDINSARNIYMKEIGKMIEQTKYLKNIK